jgi:pyridoxamine 5'-phosphate oxidase
MADAFDPRARPFLEEDAHRDPLAQFRTWFEDARAAGIRMPEAMALATAEPGGAPSVRMVLMKDADARGFVFFTSYESRKGRELDATGRAALLFSWDELGRQVRIEGPVARTSDVESAAYFATRPRPSRLAAWASRQSEPIDDRRALEAAVREHERRFDGDDVPLPPSWGGYRLTPVVYEFWQHRADRLHDRLRYSPGSDGEWSITRLAP